MIIEATIIENVETGQNDQTSTSESHMLECIYDDEPLRFEKDSITSTKKMQSWDSLEEIDLGDGTIKRSTYISAKIDLSPRTQIIKVLEEFKDYFSWDYDEMPGLSQDLVDLKLLIWPDKKPIKQIPRMFAPKVMSKIKAEIERLLKTKFIRTAM